MDKGRTERRAQAFNNLFDAVLVSDRHSRVIDLNRAAEELFGITRDDALGEHLDFFIGPEALAGERVSTNPSDKTSEIRSGLSGHLEVKLTPLFDEDGEVDGAMCVCRLEQPRNLRSRELARMAHTDALTGLPNRNLFMDRLKHALANSRRTGLPVAVLFMDLDGFKAVNDRHGHGVGDAVLASVAERLGELLRENDTLARWGGDEFVALLTDIKGERDAQRVANKLLETMRWPIKVGNTQSRLGVSIGIALAPEHGRDAEALLRMADAAMYRAKKEGRQRFAMASRDDESPDREAHSSA